mgnify:FL=1|jgi:hypothetical protein
MLIKESNVSTKMVLTQMAESVAFTKAVKEK